MKWLIKLAPVLVVLPAYGQVYKCDVGGQMVYQGTPCEGETLAEPPVPEADATKAEQLRRETWEASETDRRRQRWTFADQDQLPRAKSSVRDSFRKVLHDPGSLEEVRWGRLFTNGENYRIDLRYRAKNLMGGLGLAEHRFYLDSSMNVFNMVEME